MTPAAVDYLVDNLHYLRKLISGLFAKTLQNKLSLSLSLSP